MSRLVIFLHNTNAETFISLFDVHTYALAVFIADVNDKTVIGFSISDI